MLQISAVTPSILICQASIAIRLTDSSHATCMFACSVMAHSPCCVMRCFSKSTGQNSKVNASGQCLVGTCCRSSGWPWGQFGVVDQPSSTKKKTPARRKRSLSPVSRSVSHKSAAEAAPDGEISKPPSKRAKRAPGVGAAKVIKRGPGRRGEACHIL